jgi:ABC-2 type transport system ATP-binding protein
MTALKLNHVNKAFGSVQAVKDLSFEVRKGAIHGLLGPNGAGKTTTIRMIMQIIIQDAGTIDLFGKPMTTDMLDQIGYLPEERGLYRKMKVIEELQFLGELKGLRSREAKKKSLDWLERFDMTGVMDKKVEELSKGNQQKIQFIATIMHQPRLMILDEPFSGLDPLNAELMKTTILEMRNAGCCIIFSTHLMEQAEKLCNAICVINQGRCVLAGELAQVKRNFRKQNVLLAFDGGNGFLQELDFIESINDCGPYLEVRLNDMEKTQELAQRVVQKARLKRFEVVEPSLNEIFIETVKKQN